MPKAKKSPIWRYFRTEPTDPSKSHCTVPGCSATVSRGKKGTPASKLNTSSLVDHLKNKHGSAYAEYLDSKKAILEDEQEKEKRIEEESERETDCVPILSLTSQKKRQEYLNSYSNQHSLTSWLGGSFSAGCSSYDKYKDNDERAKERHRGILNHIILDMAPFSVVDGPGFLSYSQAMDPHYKVCSRTFYQTLMLKAYEKCVIKVQKKIDEDEPVFISCLFDGWSKFKHGYLGVKVNYITSKWKRVSLTIGCVPYDDSHTAENLSNFLTDLLDRWKLLHIDWDLVSDSASNMVAMADYIDGLEHVKCLNHVLQLCINDELLQKPEISRVIKNAREFSNYASNSVLLNDACRSVAENMDIEYSAFIQDVVTRWNSSYDMLKRFLKNEDIVRNILDQPVWRAKIKPHVKFSNKEWEVMKNVCLVLEPFKEATLELSKNVACISQYIPTVRAIEMKLKPSENDEGIRGFKERLLKNLLERLDYCESEEKFTLPCLLDPRFKHWCFRSETYKDHAVQRLVEKLEIECLNIVGLAEEIPCEEVSVVAYTENVNNNSLYGSMFEDIRSKSASSSVLEGADTADSVVKDYLNSELLQTGSILKFWSDYESDKKNSKYKLGLAKLARKYLSPPPTSTSVERLFSSAGLFLDDNRSRLLPDNLEKMLFLRSNIVASNFSLDW